MRKLAIASAAAATVLAVAACAAKPAASNDLTPQPSNYEGSLTVWLMAGGAPQSVIDTVNSQFKQKYPNVTVNVQIQQWGGFQDKLTTALDSASTPCVTEIGNTWVAKYSDAGLLANLTSVEKELGSEHWLAGAKPPGILNGQRYSIPFYLGDRVVVYNKAHFAQAGVSVPTTLAEMQDVAAKLAAVKGTPAQGYSAFYFPGKFWYGALPFIWEYGGQIAVQDSNQRWQGAVNSSQSQQGLTFLNNMVQQYSTAPTDGDETKNYIAFQTGQVGMIIDSWWAPDTIVKTTPAMADQVGVFPLPGLTPAKASPVFLGGSDLGIGIFCQTKGLAVEWTKLMTDTANEIQLAKQAGMIPNQQAAFVGHEGDPFLQVADKAAEVADMPPVAPTWANVEGENVLPDMLVSIFSGQESIPDATNEASEAITGIMNGG